MGNFPANFSVAPPLQLREAPGGQVIITLVENAVQAGESKVFAAKITGLHTDSYTTVTGPNKELVYRGNLYNNGKSAAATATAVTIRIFQIANGEQVPTNSWLIVREIENDSWEMKTGATKSETTYQGQVPVWL